MTSIRSKPDDFLDLEVEVSYPTWELTHDGTEHQWCALCACLGDELAE